MYIPFFKVGWATLLVALALGCGRRSPEYTIVTAQEQLVQIELASVSEQKAHFFTFKHSGKNVNFFVRRDREGTLQAHFDACYSCFKYKRGYVQEGNAVVCVACRIGYDLDVPIWDFVGPCVPISVPCRIQGAQVVFRLSALEKGAKYF